VNTILVAYDGSEQAGRALDRAATIATALGARVLVTSVATVPHAVHGSDSVDPTDPPEKHSAELEEAAARLAELGVQADTRLAVGDPVDAIIELADEEEVDLVVVGSRSLSTAQRMLGQSVSGPVSRKAPCDVLLVH